ncbi:DNA-binding transcriptional regulator, MarR family [Dethiosulfatibacter aminovorans DSM 17477]|uniref:DNA-binding transcriptional regulator, MarR family n=1 Tax=Dethiosulfatibacter aminovorans DSM 17477 TaxID=1121476 RepID=A0A1M6JPB3_9FIRM|nr:MarR family transcriptional regulator [Dethiosulfatibacter aminovorans]SHJ48557.1 DNA-binding transcriptional regulator, MarR family [Dethiosulfatibacter aminovorans DSM 17477]
MDRKEEFYDLMNIIYDVSDKISSYEKNPRTYGTDDLLHMIEAHTIEIIGNNKEITSSEIAKKMYKTKGAVSQTIDKLIQKGLVVKNSHPKDNRKFILELTENGKIVFGHHRRKDETAFDRYLDRLEEYSDEDFKNCKDILCKIFKLNT